MNELQQKKENVYIAFLINIHYDIYGDKKESKVIEEKKSEEKTDNQKSDGNLEKEDDDNNEKYDYEDENKYIFKTIISRYAFTDYQRDMEPFYYDILQLLDKMGYPLYNKENNIYLYTFIDKNMIELLQLGAIKSITCEVNNKNISVFGKRVKKLFDEPKKNRRKILLVGEAIWNKPEMIDVYFGESLFVDKYSYGNSCSLSKKVIDELNTRDKSRNYEHVYTQESLLGYLYGIESIVYNLSCIDNERKNDNINYNVISDYKRNFEAIREALLDIFCSDYDDDGEPVMMNVPPSFLPKKDVKKMLKDKCCKTEENYETMEFMKIMQFASTKETINITIE